MAQDTTKQSMGREPAAGATGERREQYGPDEHFEGGQGTAVSQRHPARAGERRGMTAARGGAMSPFAAGYASPFDLLQRMSEDMDRMFESFGFGPTLSGRGTRAMTPFGGPGGWGGAGGLAQAWAPRIEVCERDGKLLIEADLPGVRKEDLSVQIEQDAIVIEGQRRQEREASERGYYHSERSYGSFQRTIPLPEGADVENAGARFRDGVLEVEVPLPQRTRGRRLEIQAAQGGASTPGHTYEGSAGGAATGKAAGSPGTTGGSAGSV